MNIVDPVEESRRLQEHYAQLSEGEIQAVADDGYDLSDAAKEALRAEIRGRGLNIQVSEAPAAPEPVQASDFELSDLDRVVVQRAGDLSEARQVEQVLDNAAIPFRLGVDNLEDVGEVRSFDGGVDFKVMEADLQRASLALSTSLAPEPGRDTPSANLCPKCHSDEIIFESLDPGAKSAFDSKFNWSCDACGYQWKDDGIEAEA